MEYLLFAEDEQYEITLTELLTQAMNGADFRSHIEDKLKVYTGVKDIKGNKIYDGDTVLERGHYVNSDRIMHQAINYAPNHGAWLRGKTQRLTPNNVKLYAIELIDRRSTKFEIKKSGYYRVTYGNDTTERAEIDWHHTGSILVNHTGLYKMTEEEYWKIKESTNGTR